MIRLIPRPLAIRLACIMPAIIAILTASAAAAEFRAPVAITADTPNTLARLSRSTKGQLAWTAQNRLALIYSDYATAYTQPQVVSGRILYREWGNASGWGAAAQVNQSQRADSGPAGAAQPAILRLGDGSLSAIWQDHRNCTLAKGMMDNVEIYGDRRPAGGAWGTDVRLTVTNSGSGGDNGYLPKLAKLADGRIAMTWFDFTWTDTRSATHPEWGTASEVAVRISNAAGVFDTNDLSSVTRTTNTDRAAADNGVSFTAPDLAVDGDGIIHVIWGTDIDSPQYSKLYYGRINPATKQWIDKSPFRSGAGGQVDPAKLYTDPHTGNIWILYTDYATNGNEEVFLQQRPRGLPFITFDPPIRLTNDPGKQHYADAAFATDGTIHIVYVNESGNTNNLQYIVYNPATASIVTRQTINSPCQGIQEGGVADDYARVAITLDNWDNAYLVWENNGQLFFTTNLPAKNGTSHWRLYE